MHDVNWNDKFPAYCLKAYINDVEQYGLKETWDAICKFLLRADKDSSFLNINNLGELYEIGLAIKNKQNKKDKGQYYTPEDVCSVMGRWFDELEGNSICDVACGTGNLILSYFEIIGKDRTVKLLRKKRIYLYDLDETALKICKTAILLKYGKELENNIFAIHGDFLDSSIHLPDDCKVITNPPYASVRELGCSWAQTKIQQDTKEMYASFMEKIIKESKASVIISPYSFMGGRKFYSLRCLMNNYSGFIISFDNVPGNIFCGRKHGIFNTNTSNSVRAAITVVKNTGGAKGFQVSPLIRFKNCEREKLLSNKVLETYLSTQKQTVSCAQPNYVKCFKELTFVYDNWVRESDLKLRDFISKSYSGNTLFIPNTCRYFTTASQKELKRTGMIALNISEEKYYGFIYCFLNSSFAYWWWRLFDGGITYPIGLLEEMPVFAARLTEEILLSFEHISNEMIALENDCVVTKLNAGRLQENIKFPAEYREKINGLLLNLLGVAIDAKTLNLIHSNMAFQ